MVTTLHSSIVLSHATIILLIIMWPSGSHSKTNSPGLIISPGLSPTWLDLFVCVCVGGVGVYHAAVLKFDTKENTFRLKGPPILSDFPDLVSLFQQENAK